MQGWALAEKGQQTLGTAQMQQGLDALRATGAVLWRPYHLALLAESYAKANQTETALTILDEALYMVHENGIHLTESELYRLKGIITLQIQQNQRSKVEAENCFRQALAIAHRQGARSLGIARDDQPRTLLAKQGRRDEARTTLAEIYGWFTEGFDTADLKDAKALLDQLNG